MINLQTLIKSELWQAISSTYESENFSDAILDAMHYLSDTLRSKSDADGDGVTLVGQALGGDTPRLRVNKLQTDTDRNVQKGLEQILRGLYMAIRNPRSHEQIKDVKETADAIIYFINYLLSILDQSQEPFTLDNFMERVFDPDFVETERYASLLAMEIPPSKRLDTLIAIFRRRLEGSREKLGYMSLAILSLLSEDDTAQFLTIVSDELRTVSDNKAISSCLAMLAPYLWQYINEVARLRIENKLIESINNGHTNPANWKSMDGSLGTWARDFLQYFTSKQVAANVLLSKLEDINDWSRCYAANFFMSILPTIVEGKFQRLRCISAISKAIRAGDKVVRSRLFMYLNEYPEEWIQEIVEGLNDLTDNANPGMYLADGTPFLNRGEEEIPF